MFESSHLAYEHSMSLWSQTIPYTAVEPLSVLVAFTFTMREDLVQKSKEGPKILSKVCSHTAPALNCCCAECLSLEPWEPQSGTS